MRKLIPTSKNKDTYLTKVKYPLGQNFNTHIEEKFKDNKYNNKTHNDESSVTTSSDKLWLLSCSEIWNNGYNGGAYGFAIAKEGERYKYWSVCLANFPCNQGNKITQKKHQGGVITPWGLRSPCKGTNSFTQVSSGGNCGGWGATDGSMICHGFAI